jgi:membrane protease YdiL (CAAX protease family)
MRKKAIPWRSLGRVLLFLLSCAAILAITASLPPPRSGRTQELFIGSIASLGAFALTVLFVRWEGLRLDDVGAMPGRKSLSRLAFGFLMGLLLVAMHSLVLGAAGHIRWESTPAAWAGPAILVAAGYLCLAAREELAFHGYPLRRLEQPLNLWGAQILIASVFALEHIAGGWTYAQALWGAAVGSLLFGMASLATRGLAVPIGLHAAWNFGDWMRGNRATPGAWRPIVEKGFEERVGSTGVFGYVAVMSLATLAFWWWYRVQRGTSTDWREGEPRRP